MTLSVFRGTYAAIPPKRAPKDPDECVQMTPTDGLGFFGGAVTEPIVVDQIPATSEDAEDGRYLWVIGLVDCPHGFERGDFGRARLLGQIKHTNLTGGANAHCGGELWFLGDRRIMMNGDSGRYGPASEQQLRDAALCLKDLGYTVGYLRFGERNVPKSIAVGEEDYVWL